MSFRELSGNVDEDTRKAYKAEQFFVNVGTNNNDLTGGTLHRVKRVFVHPKFKNGGPDYVFHDVGLLELSSAVQFNNRTQPVKLARRKDRPKIGAECTITGYGFNPDVEHNKHLYQVHINVIIAEQCVKELEKDSTAREVNKHEICAKAKSKNQCQGDSGGTEFCLQKQIGSFFMVDIVCIGPMHDVSTGRQVGIVSHGAADCTGDKPSVLTRVTDVWDYIESVIFTTRWQTDKNPITETQNKPQTLPFTPNSSMLNTL